MNIHKLKRQFARHIQIAETIRSYQKKQDNLLNRKHDRTELIRLLESSMFRYYNMRIRHLYKTSETLHSCIQTGLDELNEELRGNLNLLM